MTNARLVCDQCIICAWLVLLVRDLVLSLSRRVVNESCVRFMSDLCGLVRD